MKSAESQYRRIAHGFEVDCRVIHVTIEIQNLSVSEPSSARLFRIAKNNDNLRITTEFPR